MTFKKMILSGTLAVGLIGCGGDDGGTPSPITCEPTGSSYNYLINVLTLGRESAGMSPGFNLDGVSTTSTDGALDVGCAKDDLTALDGVTSGIDNQMSSLLTALALVQALPNIQDVIDEAINSGQALIVANVEYVDSLSTDDCVGMSLVTGMPLDPPRDPATMLDGTEAIEIDPTSLDPDTGEPLIQAEGEIVGGTLTATNLTMALDIPFSYEGTVVPISLTVNDATLAADITDTELTVGNIGGAISKDDLMTLAGDLLDALGIAIDLSTIETIIDPLLDMHIDATPGADACDGISAGITFGGVEAQNLTGL